MRTIRAVSSARARKLRKLGERVWWQCPFNRGQGYEYGGALVWDMAASKRRKPPVG